MNDDRPNFGTRVWRAWSTIDTAGNLPGWWRWITALLAPGAPSGLTWWAARTTTWAAPLLAMFSLSALGVTLFVLNQIAVRAWLADEIDASRRGIRLDEPPIRVDWEHELKSKGVTLSVSNDGPADAFAAQILAVSGAGQPEEHQPSHFDVRWEHSHDRKCEILRGQSHRLEVLSFIPGTGARAEMMLRFHGPTSDLPSPQANRTTTHTWSCSARCSSS
jgi:hypothetical protein